MSISIDTIYSLCKKEDKMFALIFDLPSDGSITFEWRWIGVNDGKQYRYARSVSMIEIEQSRIPDIMISDIANEDNWQ